MNKFIFGITGGTGSGKSTVSMYFKKLGVRVIDCDYVSRLVVQKDMPCLADLTKAFGTNILNEDGTLNRRKLASIVFNDSEKLDVLNTITHAYISDYIKNEIQSSDEGIIAVDGAVIIGSPVQKLCEKIILVRADKNVRLERIMKRDNIDKVAAEERINSQKCDELYLDYANYIIENNGDLTELGVEIERIYNEIKNTAQTKGEKN